MNQIEERRRAVAKGGKPHVTDAQIRRYFRLRSDGWAVGKAAQECGFSQSLATKLNRRYGNRIRRMAAPPEPIPFDQLSEDAKRWISPTPEGFESLCREVLRLEYTEWFAQLAMELLHGYESEESEYLVVNVHPHSGKSTIGTFAFVVFFTCRERAFGREPRIHLGHRQEGKAKWYLARLARTFTTNIDLIEAFGRFRPDRHGPGIPWSSTELLIEPLDWMEKQQKEPTLSVGSYEGGELSGRYDLIIWDDLLDHRNQSSVKQRADVVDWWGREAENRLDPGGLLVVSNARIGPEDLSRHLLHQKSLDPFDEESEEKNTYRRIIFPVHDPDKCTKTEAGLEHHGDWPEGCLLSEQRLTKTRPTKWRSAWRRVVHEMRDERLFRLVWQQEDVDPEGSLADPAWFDGGVDRQGWQAPGCFDRDRRFGQLPKYETPPVVSAITVDPAASNYWAVSHWLCYAGDIQVVFQGRRGRMKAPELLYRERDGTYTGILEDYWQIGSKLGVAPRYAIIEARAQQVYLTQYPFVREWCEARHVVMIPHDTHRTNKADPQYGVELNRSVYREGRLRIPYFGADEKIYAEQFKREACAWPEGDTDDMPMHHWFLTFRLPQLQSIRVSEDRGEREDVPDWAQNAHKAPNWTTVPDWVMTG